MADSQASASSPAAVPGPLPAAADLYAQRLQQLGDAGRRLHRQHLSFGWLRLLLGIAILVLLWPPRAWAVLALALFLAAGAGHTAVLTKLSAARRTMAYLQHAQARFAGAWQGRRRRAVRTDLQASLYAADLDLFGDDSLFDLLCETRTTLGEDALSTFLLHPADPATVRERQAAVEELRHCLPLRERFAAAAGPSLAGIDLPALTAWGQTPASALPPVLQWLAPLLVVLTLLAAVRFALTRSPLLLDAALMVDATLTFGYSGRVRQLFGEAEHTSRALRTAAALLTLLQQESFSAPLLVRLQGERRTGKRAADDALAHLARLVRWSELNRNMLLRVLTVPLLLSVQVGLGLGRWRRVYGTELPVWLAQLGQFEALLSLAAFSFEHPSYPFPVIQHPEKGSACFRAAALGHPLLPEQGCVRNDVRLGPADPLLLISGSNMSGKSTLLRSVGVNAVLAFAGAPVCARSLVLSPFTVAASIQVNDSLLAGRSRFYAEILRLRAIVEAAHTHPPVLFLLDELLAGTNAPDRLAGAQGLVRDLLQAGAMGLLSTHDLALTSLAPDIAARVRNVHFQDEVIDGKLAFDYTLRDGSVSRSNGLALMRLIGLDV